MRYRVWQGLASGVTWMVLQGVALANHTKVDVQPGQQPGLFYLMAAPYVVVLVAASLFALAYRRYRS